ncbi:hypothetical protein EYF80_039972 [Liparis tanakae]|uniref:Uncharacterized protein n=1 Tax=Liparis tanakae TaxID=230148 RepID=A0A4Z2G8J6_9TELE|nr:hypothetical protein EYF80_039972 [Liparis tanakae]
MPQSQWKGFPDSVTFFRPTSPSKRPGDTERLSPSLRPSLRVGASHYGADATVFGFGSARRRPPLLPVVVRGVLRVRRVMGMLAVVGVLRMGLLLLLLLLLLLVRLGGVARVLVVLRVGGRVVVVVVVVRRRVLRDLAVLGMVGVELRRVVQK